MDHLNSLALSSSREKQRILFLILDEVEILELAGPAQVFDIAARLGAPYSLHFCGLTQQVRSTQGLGLAQLEPLPEVYSTDLIVVPGAQTLLHELDQTQVEGVLTGTSVEYAKQTLSVEIRQWLIEAHKIGAHIASVCGGAIALGAAGLLDGRRCTTHWSVVSLLQQQYPKARVLDGILYVQDRGITTSAGVASGIDMAFSLLEQQCGPKLAAEVARQTVIYMRRNGSQRQQSIYLEYRNHLHPAVHKVQDWLIENTTEPTSLSELAAIANMSVRHFSRAFKEATGLTPLYYQQRLRLEVAANLMEQSNLSIEAIAARCGFDDARHFRRLWQRFFGASPSISRKQQSA